MCNKAEEYIKFDELKSRPHPPESNIEELLILINRHLQNQIEQFQTEFASDTGVDNFTLLDLSKIMKVPYNTLLNIKRYNSLPTYLQMTKFLNVGSDIITFFEELETLEGFKTLFGQNDQLKEHSIEESSQNLSSEHSQVLSSQGRRIMKNYV